MKNLIRKILREEIDSDWDFMDEIDPTIGDHLYLQRPGSYHKNPSPVEKLLHGLGKLVYLEKPLMGYYNSTGGVKINPEGRVKITSVVTDEELMSRPVSLVVWLGELRPNERLNVQKKLIRMGFKWSYYKSVKPRKDIFYITIRPHNPNKLGSNTSKYVETPNGDWRWTNSKASAKTTMERMINNGHLIPIDTNEFVNSL